MQDNISNVSKKLQLKEENDMSICLLSCVLVHVRASVSTSAYPSICMSVCLPVFLCVLTLHSYKTSTRRAHDSGMILCVWPSVYRSIFYQSVNLYCYLLLCCNLSHAFVI